MTRPNDIPQDVWDAAQKAEQDCLDTVMYAAVEVGRLACETIIARAILAERERCAQVVERSPDLANGSLNSIRAVQSIAATIRKGFSRER